MLLQAGDELGVFTTNGICCGAVVWNGQNRAITIWGDNLQTDAKDGLKKNEPLHFRVWKKKDDVECHVEVTYCDNHPAEYMSDQFSVLSNLTADLSTMANYIRLNTIPSEFALLQNYPNPFNPKTSIRFELPQDGRVDINVYNMHGQLVTTLANENKQAGVYNVEWNAINEPSGIYICKFRAGGFEKTIKLLLVK